MHKNAIIQKSDFGLKGAHFMELEQAIDRIDALQKEQESIYHFAAQRCGLSDTTLWILYLLDTVQTPLTLRMLCRRCCFPKQTVHTALCRLEEQGLLLRHKSEEFPRQRTVALTQQGKVLAKRTAGLLRLCELRAYAALGAQELSLYIVLCEKINRALRAEFEKSFEVTP